MKRKLSADFKHQLKLSFRMLALCTFVYVIKKDLYFIFMKLIKTEIMSKIK